MALFSRRGVDPDLPRHDRGFGSLNDYHFDLSPRSRRTVIVLAGSDPFQEELRGLAESGGESLETAVSPRTLQAEAVDAPIEVRLFTGRRVSGVVGGIPRGLEPVIDDALRRLDDRGVKARIPARIEKRREGYRVVLLMGDLS